MKMMNPVRQVVAVVGGRWSVRVRWSVAVVILILEEFVVKIISRGSSS